MIVSCHMPKKVRVGWSAFFKYFFNAKRNFVIRIGGKFGQQKKRLKIVKKRCFSGDFCKIKICQGRDHFQGRSGDRKQTYIFVRPNTNTIISNGDSATQSLNYTLCYRRTSTFGHEAQLFLMSIQIVTLSILFALKVVLIMLMGVFGLKYKGNVRL